MHPGITSVISLIFGNLAATTIVLAGLIYLPLWGIFRERSNRILDRALSAIQHTLGTTTSSGKQISS